MGTPINAIAAPMNVSRGRPAANNVSTTPISKRNSTSGNG